MVYSFESLDPFYLRLVLTWVHVKMLSRAPKVKMYFLELREKKDVNLQC